ncbi:helix-turn-helix domain-containing protein [Savagea sp. SN6]|uniref:Helix-turn-helix domain-containing protein n=1 Tax=Savagea serpentis TaxID=2785297 RepID=A0A8J7G5Q8_9BACL|nr:helix-turn-helix domain-containing protein [Savagea serpentis]MBF4501882.1 helix-turn-helix domain-containing protein [Savagea serpentis]
MKENNTKIVERLEKQLRTKSRELLQLNTEEETLHYLVESFKETINCEFVGIILKSNQHYEPRIWGGGYEEIIHSFPLRMEQCSKYLMKTSMYKNEYESAKTCALHATMERANMNTWFTVPLVHQDKKYGFCLIGYEQKLELLPMEHIFNEFGKDVAIAITLIRAKKKEIGFAHGLTWMANQLSPENSMSTMVSDLTAQAANVTQSDFAAIYLYHEETQTYDLHPSMYGDIQIATSVHKDELVHKQKPFQMVVPIQVNQQTLGILLLDRSNRKLPYAEEEHRLTYLLGNYFAMLIQHAFYVRQEREQKERLKKILYYQQKLVKETIANDDFESITQMVFDIYRRPVLVFDRFFRILSSHGLEEEEELHRIIEQLKTTPMARNVFQVHLKGGQIFSIWPIHGVRDLLGYLAIGVNEQLFDEFDLVTVEIATNISSIQFIKKKLAFDTNEQMKDTFLAKLFTNPLEEKEHLIQYASLFQWDIFSTHRVVDVAITLSTETHSDLRTVQAEKIYIWEQLNTELSRYYPNMLMSAYNDQYLFIIPTEYEEHSSFWEILHKRCMKIVENLKKDIIIHFGIGKVVQDISEYMLSYHQATEALNVLMTRFVTKPYIFFEKLGSYTVLHHLDQRMSEMFVNEQLRNVFEPQDEKTNELWKTLKAFLMNNGNVKGTAEQLYIHRSTIIYRLNKIEELLDKDLNDADVRFDLMMAIKLLEMCGEEWHRK